MNFKNTVFALALVASMSALAHAGPEQSNPEGPTLRLEANASREVVEDTAWAKLVVEHESRNQAEAQKKTLATMKQLVEQAKGAQGLEVQTEGYLTNPVYNKDGKITAWRSRGELRIDSKDTALVASTAADLTNLARISGAGFYLSNDARTSTEKDLIASAVKEFQSKAKVTAQAFGFTQTQVKDVAIGQSGHTPRPYAMKAMSRGAIEMAASAAAPLPMEPGKTEVSVSVSGTVTLVQ